jgi:hypothetical protein
MASNRPLDDVVPDGVGAHPSGGETAGRVGEAVNRGELRANLVAIEEAAKDGVAGFAHFPDDPAARFLDVIDGTDSQHLRVPSHSASAYAHEGKYQ